MDKQQEQKYLKIVKSKDFDRLERWLKSEVERYKKQYVHNLNSNHGE